MERKPIGDVLPGVTVAELPDGAVPLEAIVLVKILDSDGDISWASRGSEGLSDAETLGAMLGDLDRRRRDYLNYWVADDGE